MTVGETILKVTDYPFAYSAIFIILAILGLEVFDEKAFPYLALAGIAGTFLVILDPFGWIVKGYAIFAVRPDYLKKDDKKNRWDYVKSAFNTKAMDIEKDKIVSMLYFLFVLIIFSIALNSYDQFTQRFEINFNNIQCDVKCIRDTVLTPLGIAIFLVIIVIGAKGIKLPRKAEIVSSYLFAIGTTDIPRETVDSISRFIELGDWKTAEYWEEKIYEDLKYKRGKREIIIKASETIFRPLHEESVNIENHINGIIENKKYVTIAFDKWSKIKNESAHVMIDDTELRKQISNFYNKISDYNELIIKSNRRIEKLIIETASRIYSRKIRELRFWIIDVGGAHSSPNTFDCVMNNIHPLKVHENSSPLQVDVLFKKNGNDETETMTPEHTEFHKFEEFWEQITKIVNVDLDIIRLRKICKEFEVENKKLQKKYTEQIELQWKV